MLTRYFSKMMLPIKNTDLSHVWWHQECSKTDNSLSNKTSMDRIDCYTNIKIKLWHKRRTYSWTREEGSPRICNGSTTTSTKPWKKKKGACRCTLKNVLKIFQLENLLIRNGKQKQRWHLRKNALPVERFPIRTSPIINWKSNKGIKPWEDKGNVVKCGCEVIQFYLPVSFASNWNIGMFTYKVLWINPSKDNLTSIRIICISIEPERKNLFFY